jgi:hypothetical protein
MPGLDVRMKPHSQQKKALWVAGIALGHTLPASGTIGGWTGLLRFAKSM